MKFSELTTLQEVGGVYGIINTINSKIYIGSTINLKNRLNEHKFDLRKGSHCGTHLQRAYNKYGENAFEIDLLESASNKEDLLFYEQKWIDLTQSFLSKYGYNTNEIASSRLGSKASKNTKELMSKSRSRPIIQYDLNGNFVREWSSFKKASDSLGLKFGMISRIVSNKGKSTGGFMWKRKFSDNFPKQILPYQKKILRVELINTITNETIVFNKIKDLLKKYNLGGSGFSSLCRGELRKMPNHICNVIKT